MICKGQIKKQVKGDSIFNKLEYFVSRWLQEYTNPRITIEQAIATVKCIRLAYFFPFS